MPGLFDSNKNIRQLKPTVMDYQLKSGPLAALIQLPEAALLFGTNIEGRDDAVLSALQKPLGLPPLEQCVVPGDRVVIVVDPDTPALIEILTLVWEQFQASLGDELDATLVLPADAKGDGWKSLLDELPVHIRNQVAVHIHDPGNEQHRSYLATSASGERIYLSHYLTDADLVITIGVVCFDHLFGYRGTNSSVFPALSDADSIAATRRLTELQQTPRDKRPLRELADEIGWLLGTQFAVQVIPGMQDAPGDALCGAPDEVMKAGRDLLNQRWQLTVDEEFELAVVSIPANSVNPWRQLTAALETAAQLVGDGGRIAALAELPGSIGPAMEMLRRCTDPEELLKPLRREPLEDAAEVTQLINILSRCSVFLMSNLDPSFVEDLGVLSLASAAELQRLIDASESTIVVPSANYAWAQVATASAF